MRREDAPAPVAYRLPTAVIRPTSASGARRASRDKIGRATWEP
jgi:hypothetical protein